MTNQEREQLEERVIMALKTVYDPEIPVDVYELGLIYNVQVNDDASVDITMTLTSPSCPVAESLPEEVRERVAQTSGVANAKVDLTFDPPWTRDMMSEAAMLELGFM
ncbi:MAG: SUF system Fe-S cluster assembly protein [Flavobacteriales bacterium]|nr:SUF system Fe-S cluster assembly protein [Flavobacteriales bacterium]MEB2340961.1 SUF system Fe-S cluster assembly protein [Flavobacteriia bacterium]